MVRLITPPLIAVLCFLLSTGLGGCASCGGTGGGDGGGAPDGSLPDGGIADAGGLDAGGPDAGDAGPKDAGPNRPAPNPNDPANVTKDTDCDGLTDAEEFSRSYGGGATTDPANADSDGDGLADGLELGRTSSPDPLCASFTGDVDPTTTSNPVDPDSDHDGLADGTEDSNGDGALGATETDPMNSDSDGDTLPDGCEDRNGDGQVSGGETDPRLRDSDADGIPDALEDRNGNCIVDPGETDPSNPDTDGDGLLDGQEDRNANGVVDPGETNPLIPDVDSDLDGITDATEINVTGTNPNNPDTDGDGLLDGIEDKNQNGLVNPGETSALNVDTDCDGLSDGAEDANHNGRVDAGETDPTNADSDGDGLSDGLESGATTNLEPGRCTAFVPDADPGTTTDPANPDTDGDGIMDGAEDRNANGRVDPAAGGLPAELDPNNPNDASTTVVAACATQNLVPVLQSFAATGDVNFATLTRYTQVHTLTAGTDKVGLLVFDPITKVGGAVLSRAPAGADVNADLTAMRAAFAATGGETNVISQPFTSWDGYPALRGTLHWASSADAFAASDAFNTQVRSGLGGLWGGASAGVSGGFEVAFELIRRAGTRSVYVMAFSASASENEALRIARDDLANGSPLAQIGDTIGVQCDTYLTVPSQPVEFLYVIDNSCSMNQEQSALAGATTSTVTQLQNSTLDWRVGVIYTDYYRTSLFQGFTTNLTTFASRTTPGTGGSGDERSLESTQNFVTGPDGSLIRNNAKLVTVILSDEDEQSNGLSTAAEDGFISFFQTQGISMNGLICRPGFNSVNVNCWQGRDAPTYDRVITSLGGVLGSIQELGNIGATISTIITTAGGATSPYVLSRAPISATLKVALEHTDGSVVDVPRSRLDGFDYDGASHSIQLFGSFRPDGIGLDLAVSYRYWRDQSPLPAGQPPCGGACASPFLCNPVTDQCECPADCGIASPGAGFSCDPVACQWTCPADCGGICTGNQVCDTASCGCACSQNVSCGAGYAFDAASCGCACDALQFDCGGVRTLDLQICACTCDATCGGNCAAGESCNASTCSCVPTDIP